MYITSLFNILVVYYSLRYVLSAYYVLYRIYTCDKASYKTATTGEEKSRLTSTAYLFRGWEAHSARSSWAGSPVPVRCSWRSHCQCVCGLCARRHLPAAVPGGSTASSEADCWSRLPAESHSSGRRAVSPTATGRNLKLQHFWGKVNIL